RRPRPSGAIFWRGMAVLIGVHRPRSHALGDLGVNFIEAVVLACGFAVERVRSDYGTDLLVTTVTNDVVDNGLIRIQSKAHWHVRRLKNGDVSEPIERRHIRLWLKEP